MYPVDDRTALIQAALPADPTSGQKFKLGENQSLGGANVINVYKGSRLLGTTTRLVPIQNVSGKYYIERAAVREVIKPRHLIRLKGVQYTFNELTFIEYFGWVGTGTLGEPTLLLDKTFRVLDSVPIGPSTDGFYLYEKVYLKAIQGEKNVPQSKPTNASSTGGSPSKRKTTTPRRSRPAPRTNTATRSGPNGDAATPATTTDAQPAPRGGRVHQDVEGDE